jgi:hypothetical protein
MKSKERKGKDLPIYLVAEETIINRGKLLKVMAESGAGL